MNTADNREETLFREALQRPKGPEREAYLDQACAGDPVLRARLDALLQAHESPDPFLEPQVVPPTCATVPTPPEEGPGTLVGRYKIMEKIGEGGYGLVYVAEQREPVKRRVALKIIKLGMDTKEVVARFEAERQALAMMDHPNIAKVLDGGATEAGRPYFVMELVRGIRITDYCDQNNLSTEARLKLFIEVCHAIQHAHQKGVIHRDIKPSNILVMLADDTPGPKVIDFGIAKAIGERLTDNTVYTRFEQFIGTPAYTSPEQAGLSGLDVDTRSDIYSLGVLLYELLTGRKPFESRQLAQAGVDEILRCIREQEPPKPSTRLSRLERQEQTTTAQRRGTELPKLIRLLRGDLDWIVMKCLEKDRTRRYETANELGRDIERYLTQQPTVARPPSTAYRVQKFVRRHRAMVGAAGLVVGALVLGILASTWQAVRATRAEKAAHEAVRVARQNLYSADMNLACQACQENNLGLARELLNKHRPAPHQPDLRGWEWRYLWGLCQSEVLYTLGTHGHYIFGVAISPNGRLLATTGGEVKIWDLDSRRLVETPQASGALDSVAFSPDGKMLAFGTRKDGVKLWDVQEHREITHFPGEHEDNFGQAALGFSPSGGQLAIGAKGGSVVLWDLATHTAGLPLKGHSYEINSLVFSPDGQTLVTGSWDKTIRIWDLGAHRQVVVLTNHTRQVACVALSPDGKTLASGGLDKTVRIWDLAQHREVAVLTNHTRWVSALAFSPDGRNLASASTDGSIKFWETRNWREVSTLECSQDEVFGVVFSRDGKTLFTGTMDGKILAWDGKPRPPKARVLRRPDDAQDLELSLPSGIPICWHSNNTFNLWDTLTLRKQPEHPVPAFDRWTNIIARALSPGGKRLAFATTEGSLYLWDVEGERVIARLAGWPTARFTGWPPRSSVVGFSPDGKFLAEVVFGKGFKLWKLETLEEVATLTNSAAEPATYFCFATNNVAVAVGNWDGTVAVWDLVGKARVNDWRVNKAVVTGVAFMPDGKRLVTTGWDRTAKVWELETQQEVRSFARTKNCYLCVAVSPDGQRIAAGTWEGGIKIWNSTTGQEVANLKNVDDWVDPEGHYGWDWVRSLAFLPPDGDTLILCTRYEVRFWRAPSWAEIKAAEKREDELTGRTR